MAKVLIVDDETVILDILSTIVEELGHEPLCACNGDEAWELLTNQFEVPALVITDWMMPVSSGIELIQRIRNSPRLRMIPVMLMSAAQGNSQSNLADCFIHKPFDLTDLEAEIERFLANRFAQNANQNKTNRSNQSHWQHIS